MSRTHAGGHQPDKPPLPPSPPSLLPPPLPPPSPPSPPPPLLLILLHLFLLLLLLLLLLLHPTQEQCQSSSWYVRRFCRCRSWKIWYQRLRFGIKDEYLVSKQRWRPDFGKRRKQPGRVPRPPQLVPGAPAPAREPRRDMDSLD